MTHCDTTAIVAWLADGARSAVTPEAVLNELCERLVACGVPLWRVAAFVHTLHPEQFGRRFVWLPDAGIATRAAPHALVETAEYRDSTIVVVTAGGVPLRRRIADPDCPLDFAILQELREEGATDYFAMPLRFSDGTVHAATWTTRRPGGFAAAQIAALETIAAPFSRVAEIWSLRRTASNLLNTYVGRQAGERILAGQIRRGHTEEIEAAIWLSDMRGFTALADLLAPADLIPLLNRFFDCQVPAILDHGGEVLKFMGDGLLAIFPVGGGERAMAQVCADALAAALAARATVATLDLPGGDGRPRFGLALHCGQVHYGNIGSGPRLDFTCIGPAVNLAARIEKLAGRFERTVLASADFARYCPTGLTAIGAFALPGFGAAHDVFGLADEARPIPYPAELATAAGG
jgi:adenylate cyclase